mgnify:CR=1 FL=1
MSEQQKIRIKLKAFDHKSLDQSVAKIIDAVKKTGADVSGPIPLPTEKEVVTILRAVHKYKDSREQFEEADRHHQHHTQDRRCADKAGSARRRGHRNQIIVRELPLV